MAVTARPLGRAQLVVVGCGPTGIAGLVEAALQGIPAIGIEAGPAPLASIGSYVEGLVFASPAENYEVGGLPLDCRAADRITREEVLDYYARVIRQHRLDIRCRTRCLGLEPRGRDVVVRVSTAGGPGWLSAERVLVTSWYERRPLGQGLLAGDHGIAVHSGIQNSMQLAGKRVVVLGGGLSAYEAATRLLQSGQAIVLLSRGAPRPLHETPGFRQLVAATGSLVCHRISGLALGRSRVRFTHEGVRSAVPCDALVAAIGQRLRADVLRMLVRAGVLSRRECGRLRQARSYETLLREFPHEEEGALRRRAVAELPDLGELVFAGRRGVHLAGGALHVGAANGGVVYSLLSAVLAVRSLAGQPPPDGAVVPLAEFLLASCQPEAVPPARALERIASLRPLRTTGRMCHPERSGMAAAAPGRPRRDDPDRARILLAADGTLAVARLARRLGIRDAAGRARLLGLLRELWWNGGLTWLPAGGRSEG